MNTSILLGAVGAFIGSVISSRLHAHFDRRRLRNVAAWAVEHQARGGIHDARSILAGHADRRIAEAACGDIPDHPARRVVSEL